MLDILHHFTVPPSAAPSATTENDEERIRALETLAALSALFGQPSNQQAPTGCVAKYDEQSVLAWSSQVNKPAKELLADPMACPPYTDPTSILIVDQGTLEYEIDTQSRCSSTEDSSDSERSTVRFRASVAVVEIPSHRDLDPEIVESVWSSTDEVHENGRRNALEYNWDGRDWTKVLEEHEMIYDPISNNYIHPATWEEMELDRLHQQHMRELAELEAERQERHRAETLKKGQRRRRRKDGGSSRSPTRPSPKLSPGNQRRRVPQVAPSASLTRFADT